MSKASSQAVPWWLYISSFSRCSALVAHVVGVLQDLLYGPVLATWLTQMRGIALDICLAWAQGSCATLLLPAHR